MSLRTPLARVLGLGSAGEGVSHWWVQRVTAVALIPLGLWFLGSLLLIDTAQHAAVVEWLAAPLNAVLLALLVFTVFYHSHLGLQVVIEDYVHGRMLRLVALVSSKFAHIALGAVAIYSILRVAAFAASAGIAGNLQ